MRFKWFRYGVVVLGSMLALCLVFSAGIFVGRAGGRQSLFPIPWLLSVLSHAHGAVGAIDDVEGSKIVLRLRDGSTTDILVDSQTRIEKDRVKLGLQDLKVGDQIQVIGSPTSDGGIDAKWLHVFDRNSPVLRPTPTPTVSPGSQSVP